MKKMKTVVVENEQKNMELMLHFIKKYCPTLEIVVKCLTFDEALHVLSSTKVDLVFFRYFTGQKHFI